MSSFAYLALFLTVLAACSAKQRASTGNTASTSLSGPSSQTVLVLPDRLFRSLMPSRPQPTSSLLSLIIAQAIKQFSEKPIYSARRTKRAAHTNGWGLLFRKAIEFPLRPSPFAAERNQLSTSSTIRDDITATTPSSDEPITPSDSKPSINFIDRMKDWFKHIFQKDNENEPNTDEIKTYVGGTNISDHSHSSRRSREPYNNVMDHSRRGYTSEWMDHDDLDLPPLKNYKEMYGEDLNRISTVSPLVWEHENVANKSAGVMFNSRIRSKSFVTTSVPIRSKWSDEESSISYPWSDDDETSASVPFADQDVTAPRLYSYQPHTSSKSTSSTSSYILFLTWPLLLFLFVTADLYM